MAWIPACAGMTTLYDFITPDGLFGVPTWRKENIPSFLA
jgi:hypothetical protein